MRRAIPENETANKRWSLHLNKRLSAQISGSLGGLRKPCVKLVPPYGLLPDSAFEFG